MEFRAIQPKICILNKQYQGQKLQLGQYCNSISYNNQISDEQPAGTFQVELIPGSYDEQGFTALQVMSIWQKIIRLGDIISLGLELEHSFLGRVESITEAKSSTDNSVARALILSGRSFAAILFDDKIQYAPQLDINKKAVELLGGQRTGFLGILKGLSDKTGENVFYNEKHPFCAVLWILLNMPSVNIEIEYANYDENGEVAELTKEKIGSYLLTSFIGYKDDVLMDITLSQFANSSVWNYITRTLDTMFYEIFVETVTRHPDTDELLDIPRPCLFIRPRPWDRTNCEDLLNQTDVRYFTTSSFSVVKEIKTVDGIEQAQIKVDISKEAMEKLPKMNWKWDSEMITTSIPISNGSFGTVPKRQMNNYVTLLTREPYHTIGFDEEIREFSSVRTTDIRDIYSYYYLKATKGLFVNTPLYEYGFLFPMIDARLVNKYGMRPLEGVTNALVANAYNDFNADGVLLKQKRSDESYYASSTAYRTKRNRLFHWNRPNEIFLHGRKTIKGTDRIRCGDKSLFTDELTFQEGYKGIFYYVTGYDQQWKSGGPYRTTLNVTRGSNPQQIARYEEVNGYSIYDKNPLDERSPVITNDVVIHKEKEAAGTKTNVRSNDTSAQTDFDGGLSQAAEDYIKKQYGVYKSKYTEQGVKSAKQLCDLIEHTANDIGINANILFGLIKHESGDFNPYAKATTGTSTATGLGQFTQGACNDETVIYTTKITVKMNSSQIEPFKFEDQRMNPIVIIPKIGSHLQRKGFLKGYGLKELKKAITNYGEVTEAYFQKVLREIKAVFPNTKLK